MEVFIIITIKLTESVNDRDNRDSLKKILAIIYWFNVSLDIIKRLSHTKKIIDQGMLVVS